MKPLHSIWPRISKSFPNHSNLHRIWSSRLPFFSKFPLNSGTSNNLKLITNATASSSRKSTSVSFTRVLWDLFEMDFNHKPSRFGFSETQNWIFHATRLFTKGPTLILARLKKFFCCFTSYHLQTCFSFGANGQVGSVRTSNLCSFWHVTRHHFPLLP